MNGRAYDYDLGRFLSVDPFIQFPANSQSLNPYSYIMNNPLSGTDPTGYRGLCDVGATGCGSIDFSGSSQFDLHSSSSRSGNGAGGTGKSPFIVQNGGSDGGISSIGAPGLRFDTGDQQKEIEDENSQSSSDGEAAARAAAIYVGQQLGDAGAERERQSKKVKALEPDYSKGRSKIKGESRGRTPKLVAAAIEAMRGPSLEAKPGSGGQQIGPMLLQTLVGKR